MRIMLSGKLNRITWYWVKFRNLPKPHGWEVSEVGLTWKFSISKGSSCFSVTCYILDPESQNRS